MTPEEVFLTLVNDIWIQPQPPLFSYPSETTRNLYSLFFIKIPKNSVFPFQFLLQFQTPNFPILNLHKPCLFFSFPSWLAPMKVVLKMGLMEVESYDEVVELFAVLDSLDTENVSEDGNDDIVDVVGGVLDDGVGEDELDSGVLEAVGGQQEGDSLPFDGITELGGGLGALALVDELLSLFHKGQNFNLEHEVLLVGLEVGELGIDLGLDGVNGLGSAGVLAHELLVLVKGAGGEENNQEASENDGLHLNKILQQNGWTAATFESTKTIPPQPQNKINKTAQIQDQTCSAGVSRRENCQKMLKEVDRVRTNRTHFYLLVRLLG